MSLDNFTNFKADVKDYLARPNIADSVVETWIVLAESQMYNDLRVREMVCEARADLNDEYEWLPSDWLEVKHINILEIDDGALADGTITNTYHLPYEENREQVRYDYSGESKPRHWHIVGERIRFTPFPDVASGENSGLGFELVFYARWNPLDATNPTNTILTNYPQLYLFATLMQAEGYLVGDPRIQTWAMLYQQNLDTANRKAEGAQYGTMAIGMAY